MTTSGPVRLGNATTGPGWLDPHQGELWDTSLGPEGRQGSGSQIQGALAVRGPIPQLRKSSLRAEKEFEPLSQRTR